MPCDKCREFPYPLDNYEEIAVHIGRHAGLIRCKSCGILFEMHDEERGPRFPTIDAIRNNYKEIFGDNGELLPLPRPTIIDRDPEEGSAR